MQHRFLLLVFALVLLSSSVFAASIKNVKGQLVLIELEGTSASIDQKFFALDSGGKKKALIIITKSKDSKAVGKVVKGVAQVGYTLGEVSGSSGGKSKLPISAGLILDYSMDSMTIASDNIRTETTGSSISFSAFAQYVLKPTIDLRAVLGLKNFVTKKDSPLADVKITFFTGELWGKYNFMSSQALKVWGGGAVGFLYPSSASSNAIDTTSLGFTPQVLLGGGADYQITNQIYITGYVDYRKMLFSGDIDTASSIELNVGGGYHF